MLSGTTSISGNFSVTVPPPPYAPIGNYSKNYNPNYQAASVLGDITINTTTNSSNIDYNGNGDQTVLAIDYYNLTLSNSGTKFFGAGTVGIGGDLSINDLAVADAITYNDTVKYFGTNKTVRYGFVNKNLKIDGDCAVTSNTDLSVTNSLVINPDGTLDMNNNVLTVNGALISDGTFISTNAAGSMSFYSKNSGDANLLNSWANSGYNGTTTTRLPGTVNNDVLIIGNKTINITSNVSNLGTIKVELSGILNQTDGIVSTKDLVLKNDGIYNQSGGELQINHDLKVPTGTTFNGTGGTVHFTGAAGGGADYSGNVQFNNLLVDAGADYNMDNNSDVIKISGNYTNNNSSLDNDKGTLTFNGTSPQTIYSASTPASTKTMAGNVTVSNPNVTLLSDIGIQTSLAFNSGGHINKNGNEIYLNGVLYTGPTPVELVSFDASVKNNSVLLIMENCN